MTGSGEAADDLHPCLRSENHPEPFRCDLERGLSNGSGTGEASRRFPGGKSLVVRDGPPPDRRQLRPAVWQESLGTIVPVLLSSLTGELTAEFTADQIRVSGWLRTRVRARVARPARPLAGSNGGLGLKLDTENHIEGEKAVTAVELTAVYEGGLLVIKGKLPKPEIVAAIEARIQDKMPDLLVKNEVSAAPESAGDEWAGGLVEFFAEALGRVSTGTFTFKDGVLELEGRTVALPDRQLIQNLAVNLLPPRFKIENRLLHADQPFPKPVLQPEQRTRLAEALKPLPVYFEKNSEVLEEEEKRRSIRSPRPSRGPGRRSPSWSPASPTTRATRTGTRNSASAVPKACARN